MRFPCIYKPAKAEGAPPTPKIMETMGKFIEQTFKEGFLLSTEGCLPSALGARVRLHRRQLHRHRRPLHRAQRDGRRRDRDPPALRTARKITPPALAAE
jgi:hypothetical protein